jgi:hypothetical protein
MAFLADTHAAACSASLELYQFRHTRLQDKVVAGTEPLIGK